ncbi:MAG TPA: sugar ABC transporter permease [Clostridiales bacterium]|jgi:multiple sugar transport system permease protein|nr:sugar ABC transporter permease [Clostridiales bacterium]
MKYLLFYFILLAAICLIVLYAIHLHRKHKKSVRPRNKINLEPFFYTAPVFILLVLMFGYPLLNSFIMAFENYKLTEPDRIYINGFDNFTKIFSDSDFLLIAKNSLIYVVLCVLFQFIFGMILALALRKKFRGRGVYQAIVFLPWALSGFVVGLLFRWSFNGEYGIVNDVLLKMHVIQDRIPWLGTPGYSLLVVIIAMIWMGIPFFAIMILAALQSIPKEIYEAADMDGCGAIKKFFSITIPFIKPTIIMTLLLRTIWIFNSFDLIVVITGGGPANTSQTIPSYMYTMAFSSYDFGMAAALGVVLIMVLGLYSIFFLKMTKYSQAGDF